MAVPTIQITGSVVSPDGQPLTSGVITAELSQPGSALDGATSVRVVGKITATITAGAIGSDFDLVPNDAITPAGTFYRVTISGTTADGQVYRSTPPEKWQLSSSPASIDVGAVTRLSVTPGIPATIPTATATAPGAVQLAGDLGGTAASPQVVGTHLAAPLPEAQGGTAQTTFAAALAAAGISAVPDADATTKGKVQLAGDLGGTAAAPTVPFAHAYDLCFFLAGVPTDSQLLAQIVAVRSVTLPAGLTASKGSVRVNPTSEATITIKHNGTTVGTATVSTGGVFSFAAASPIVLAAGDLLTLNAQASADATLEDISITLVGAV